MSTKNSKSQPQKSREELRRQLARDIVSIFNNPETPSCIANALSEGTGDLFNHVSTERREASEAYYLSLLDALAAQEKGGARLNG
jgi:hypothetical protein